MYIYIYILCVCVCVCVCVWENVVWHLIKSPFVDNKYESMWKLYLFQYNLKQWLCRVLILKS